MSKQYEGLPLENLEETERQTLAQKYLRNPFSIHWSLLAQLSQTHEPVTH